MRSGRFIGPNRICGSFGDFEICGSILWRQLSSNLGLEQSEIWESMVVDEIWQDLKDWIITRIGFDTIMPSKGVSLLGWNNSIQQIGLTLSPSLFRESGGIIGLLESAVIKEGFMRLRNI
ncbi:unnamed protein product [Cochlearia groenlandica]